MHVNVVNAAIIFTVFLPSGFPPHQGRICRKPGKSKKAFNRKEAEATFKSLVKTHEKYGWVSPPVSDGWAADRRATPLRLRPAKQRTTLTQKSLTFDFRSFARDFTFRLVTVFPRHRLPEAFREQPQTFIPLSFNQGGLFLHFGKTWKGGVCACVCVWSASLEFFPFFKPYTRPADAVG